MVVGCANRHTGNSQLTRIETRKQDLRMRTIIAASQFRVMAYITTPPAFWLLDAAYKRVLTPISAHGKFAVGDANFVPRIVRAYSGMFEKELVLAKARSAHMKIHSQTRFCGVLERQNIFRSNRTSSSLIFDPQNFFE